MVSRLLIADWIRGVTKDKVRNEVDMRGLSVKETQPQRIL